MPPRTSAHRACHTETAPLVPTCRHRSPRPPAPAARRRAVPPAHRQRATPTAIPAPAGACLKCHLPNPGCQPETPHARALEGDVALILRTALLLPFAGGSDPSPVARAIVTGLAMAE